MRRLRLLPLLAILTSLSPATAAEPLAPCRGVEGALCGSVAVPLDRHDKVSTEKLSIGFELYRRAEAEKPSLGTLVFMEGGPGYSSTASRDWYLDLAGEFRARRDVLLVDARGTGRSGALDCPALQSYRGNYLDAAKACAKQLGAAATLFGSGNAAEDLVAVLDRLGIGKIDLYGDSYGSFNAQTFAVRHPERTRSLVLDGAYPIAGLDPWYPDTSRALSRAFALVCARSAASCPVAPDATDAAIKALAERLHAAPVRGTVPDADGVPRAVEATVDTLISTLSAADGQPAVYRELFAAKAALEAGDPAPLLRLVAETTWWGDAGRPRVYSEAHAVAVSCHDYPWTYDLAGGRRQRRAQMRASRRALPGDVFAPFGRRDWGGASWPAFDLCLTWPAPKYEDPPLPPATRYPSVPTLIINGDLDQRTSSEGARRIAENFPVSTFVEVANLGHVTALNDFDGCTESIVRGFWQTLSVPDTRCARKAYSPVRVTRSFPRRLADVDGSWTQGAGDERIRRATVLAAATAADVIARWSSMLGSKGVGLRGGSFEATGFGTVRFTLDGARLAEDVAVSGTIEWRRRSGAVSATLSLAGAVRGELRIAWPDERPETLAFAEGTIDGTPVRATFGAP